MTDHLDVLLADGVIDEVLGRLKSGKEANISLVRRGDDVLAAKVYKDRSTRSFKNNADYKEGRKVRNSRTQRAIDGGGRFGRDAAEQAWKSAEADALYKLVGSGVRVPLPVMFYEGVLLMELVKDGDGRPAPRLIDVAIEPAAAIGVYADLVAQLIAMLCCDLIHGDLSPYNILAAAEGPTIIDFPQVVSAVHSSRAEFFFLRDFDNVVRFVAGFDPSLAVHRSDGRAIWRAYVGRELTRDFVPPPPAPPPAQGRGGNRGRDPRYDARRDDRPGPRDPRPSNGAPQGGPNGRRYQGDSRSQVNSPSPNGAPQGRPDGRRYQSDSRSPSNPPPNGAPPGGTDERRYQGRGAQSSSGPARSSGASPSGTDGRGYQERGPQSPSNPQRSSGGPQGGGPNGQTTRRHQRDPQAQPDARRGTGGPPTSQPDRAGPPAERRASPPPRPQREWSNAAPSPASPASPSRGGRRRPKRHW